MFNHVPQLLKVALIGCLACLLFGPLHLDQVVLHFIFRDRLVAELTLLYVLDAVVVVELKGLLCDFLRAIVAENVWVFSTSRDEGAIRIFVFRRLSLSIDLCLSLRWTRLDLLFQFGVFFPEFRDKVLGLAQLLLNLAVFVFQEIQPIIFELLGGWQVGVHAGCFRGETPSTSTRVWRVGLERLK